MTTTWLPSTEGLISAAVRGQSRARAELERRLRPVVRARVQRRLGPRADIDDFVQDVWLYLFEQECRRLRAFAAENGGTLEGFVGRITENRVIDLVRERSAQRRGGHLRAVPDPDLDNMAAGKGTNPAELVEATELADKLTKYLESVLEERDKLILQLLYRDGLPPPKVAAVLGVTVQVIYNRQYRIRRDAQNFLAEQDVTPFPATQVPRLP